MEDETAIDAVHHVGATPTGRAANSALVEGSNLVAERPRGFR